MDVGFRPGIRALSYRILKGATISWCVPKGTTFVGSAKGPNTKVSLFETNQTISALRDAPFTFSPSSATLNRADAGQGGAAQLAGLKQGLPMDLSVSPVSRPAGGESLEYWNRGQVNC